MEASGGLVVTLAFRSEGPRCPMCNQAANDRGTDKESGGGQFQHGAKRRPAPGQNAGECK
jgi:hypothetical protein